MQHESDPEQENLAPHLNDLLLDRNKDGFPDDISALMTVSEELDRATWEAVINLAARLGLQSSGFTPPIVATEPLPERRSIQVNRESSDYLNSLAVSTATMTTEDSGDSGESEPSVPTVDLTDRWSISGFLVDRDGDEAADDSAIHLTLPAEMPVELGAALAELACRIGVECRALTLPIAGEEIPGGRVPLRIHLSEDVQPRIGRASDQSVELSGTTAGIAELIRRIAGQSHGILPGDPGKQGTEWLRRSIAGWTDEGKAARLRQAVTEMTASAQARLTILERARTLLDHLCSVARDSSPDVHISVASPREDVVFDHQWTAEWEVVRLLKTLDADILPALDRSIPVSLIAMVSEPPAVRRRMRGQITRRMLDLGFSEGSVHVLDAYKPGLCWVTEIILPVLRMRSGVDRIKLQFRPLDPEQHEGQLDMPIRWLQELFPADEILARELSLPLDHISLEAVEDLSSNYRLVALDAGGRPLLERSFSPLWRRIDYLSGMPGAGNVTVTTGGIIAEQDSQLKRAHVLTDPEIFWRYVQGELLPNLRRFILSTTDSQPAASQQPFFDELYIELRISESDEPYGIRQERHSAAEALHEDIYFTVLDYIEELGNQTTGEKLSAPGSVRPFVTVQSGRQPEARIRLTRRPEGIARIAAGNGVETVRPVTDLLPPSPEVHAIEWRGDQLIFELAAIDGFERFDPFLTALAAECPPAHGDTILRISMPSGTIEIGVITKPDPPERTEPEQDFVPWDTIISNDQLFPYLYRLAEHPSVHLIPVAERSWEGRPIPAIALTAPQEAEIWSMRKLSHFKPTMLIVARHHANEVASTTAALQLIERVTNDPDWGALLDRVNVLLVPLENPDGAALHDKLRRDNPHWKHHPARYNATGYEFGEDQGNPDSQYGEGRIRDLAWSACLPDIVVDNHGVPSHEWAQLFAGFGSPPRFIVSYWQVQALLYGILPYLDESPHAEFATALRDRVASKIAGDEDLLRWNRIYAERYRTWGHQWVPDRFPMTQYQEMIFHSGPIDPESTRARRSYAVRYPKATVVNWVTEVCDETVEGKELERTARAQLLANVAALELLRDSSSELRTTARSAPNGVTLSVGRDRPLHVRSDIA